MQLEDQEALVEINLYSELVIAATSSDGPLSLDEIDVILGVTVRRPVKRA
jgi:hypothetical protein